MNRDISKGKKKRMAFHDNLNDSKYFKMSILSEQVPQLITIQHQAIWGKGCASMTIWKYNMQKCCFQDHPPTSEALYEDYFQHHGGQFSQ